MSNPTFVQGPITYEAAEALEKGRLVTVADGKVKHAGAEGQIQGAVVNVAAPDSPLKPKHIAVYYGVAVVPLEVDGDATAIKAGQAVFAAADGKAAATGTVQVGVAARDGAGKTVETILTGLPHAA